MNHYYINDVVTSATTTTMKNAQRVEDKKKYI